MKTTSATGGGMRRRRAKEYTSVAAIPSGRGFAVIVPPGLFDDGPTVWWHYKEERARQRAKRVRARVADVRIEELKRGD